MRYLLALYVLIVTFCDVSGMGLGILPGLSAKNILLYTIGGLLVLQTAVGQTRKIELKEIQTCLAVIFIYSLITWVVAGYIIEYPSYDLKMAGMELKGGPFDWLVMYLVFFYAVESADVAKQLIKVILISISVANLITVLTVAGLIDVGAIVFSEVDDRISGSFGHANETGTMISCFLPAYIAAADSSRGWRRVLWIAAGMTSFATFFLTQSRGALVGLFVGGAWAVVICRKHLSATRAVHWLSICAGVFVPVLALVGFKYWHQLIARFTDPSTASAADMSSGRTDIWMDGILRMMDTPITFVTGFGWRTWESMGFKFLPHNEYLFLWFELGLVGLLCFIYIIRRSVYYALSVAAKAEPELQRYMVAFVFGMLMLSVGIFFAHLLIPWLHIWPYVALVMRYALASVTESKTSAMAMPERAVGSSSLRQHSSNLPVSSRPAIGRRSTAGNYEKAIKT